LRLAAGLTQEGLAERAGLSVRAISDLERGARRRPYPHTVQQLARALRLSAAERARLAAALPRRAAPAAPPPPIAAPPAPAATGDGGPPRPAGHLPLALTSFVGRAGEIAEVRRLLGATRLLTLTGAGGIGKTRLALAVARDAQAGYPDGVWLVELAALADPALLPQVVAQTFGVQEQPGRPLTATLSAWVTTKHLLLVLDNCEHLLDACAPLAAALLRAAPRLTVLATSREPLRITGETAWRVPSLALPAPEPPPASVDDLTHLAATRLFVERARAVRPALAIRAGEAAMVAEICRRLDGIPLAIELAAARVRALSIAEVAARLDDRFRLLTGGSRTALPRQQTLRATLDWSHDLLGAPERALLRRLAVFAGGWTLDAAEAVGAGEAIDAAAVLDLLTGLVDKSLVQVDEGAGGTARYRLLETVRQYALELLAADEEVLVRGRHAAWCLALVQQAQAGLQADDQSAWYARLAAEDDNLRAALAWLLAHNPDAGLRLAGRLWDYWMAHSHFTEGQSWLASLLAQAPAPTADRARALLRAASLARVSGNMDRARAWCEEGLPLSRHLGDACLTADWLGELGAFWFLRGDLARARPLLMEGVALSRLGGHRPGLALNLYFLGRIAQVQSDFGRARALLEESLALGPAGGSRYQGGVIQFQLGLVVLAQGDVRRAEALAEEALAAARRVGSGRYIGMALEGLGQIAAWRGDLARATELGEASLALFRPIDYRHGMAAVLARLGRVAFHAGDGERAKGLLDESLSLFSAIPSWHGRGIALHGLGLVAWRQGDAASAMAHLRESLAIWREQGDQVGITECLEGLAAVEAGTSRPARAARLLGAAAAQRAAIGAPLPPVERPGHDATVSAVRAALGEATFAAAWAEGQAMPLEQAVAEALGAAGLPPVAEAGAPDGAVSGG
jgi:non-specific serine/threonine protein kinase